jgi:hypothetical protein
MFNRQRGMRNPTGNTLESTGFTQQSVVYGGEPGC